MKKIILFLITVTIISCNSSKEVINTKKTAEIPLSIILESPDQGFKWDKGTKIDIKARIKNNTEKPISIVHPSTNSDFYPSPYEAEITNDFEGVYCVEDMDSSDDYTQNYVSEYEFLTIEPKSEELIYFTNDFLNYCGENSSGAKQACFNVKMYAHKTVYSLDSELITKHYSHYSLEEKQALILLYNQLPKSELTTNTICVDVE